MKMNSTALLEYQSSAKLPNKFGLFDIHVFKELDSGKEHIALTTKLNTVKNKQPLVRIHSSCITGDIFGSLRCDCKPQLDFALDEIAKNGGMLIYLNQEGRGIGISAKIKAYALQEEGLNTLEANVKLGFKADLREYHIAVQILKHFGFSSIKLITNNPAKLKALNELAINVERYPSPVFLNEHNENYLATKKSLFGHII